MNKTSLVTLALAPLMCIAGNEDLVSFDFRGIPDLVCNVSNLSEHAERDELPVNCNEFLLDASQKYALGVSFVFQSVLSAAELRACAGDRASYCTYMESIADLLRHFQKNEQIAGRSVYECNFARTEYSLARVINGESGARISLTADDVKRWLPDSGDTDSKDGVNLVRFRALLVIGAAIEQYRREHNRLPENLKALVDNKALGVAESDLTFGGLGVEYRKGNAFWKLRVGRNERRVPEPIYDFVPAAFQIAGTHVDEVWFASSYSKKRNELFVRGFLPSDDSSCRCKMKGCVVIRGGVSSSTTD